MFVTPAARARRYAASPPCSVQYAAFEKGWHGAPPTTTSGSLGVSPARTLSSWPVNSLTSARSTFSSAAAPALDTSVAQATSSSSTESRNMPPASRAPRPRPPAPAKRSTIAAAFAPVFEAMKGTVHAGCDTLAGGTTDNMMSAKRACLLAVRSVSRPESHGRMELWLECPINPHLFDPCEITCRTLRHRLSALSRLHW